MAGDERSRLHEIVNRLPEAELALACQLLELLVQGGAALRASRPGGALSDSHEGFGNSAGDGVDEPLTSPEMISKLSQLTDEELLRLDDLLETDREGAKQFWRERFGEELADDQFSA